MAAAIALFTRSLKVTNFGDILNCDFTVALDTTFSDHEYITIETSFTHEQQRQNRILFLAASLNFGLKKILKKIGVGNV